MSMPNLFPFLPVVILAWVRASTSGLTRMPTGAVRPIDAATRLSSSSSDSDSTLIWAMPASSAAASSSRVLPTPANRILSAGTPAAIERRISPSDTTSAPAPARARVAITARLAFAFTA